MKQINLNNNQAPHSLSIAMQICHGFASSYGVAFVAFVAPKMLMGLGAVGAVGAVASSLPALPAFQFSVMSVNSCMN